MNYQNVFWDRVPMGRQGFDPSILAVGENQFWYPFSDRSLFIHLRLAATGREYVAPACGANRAEEFEYIRGTSKKRHTATLERYNSFSSAAFISDSSDDFANLNKLQPPLEAECTDCVTVEHCSRADSEPESITSRLNRVKKSCIALIDKITDAIRSATPGLAHATRRTHTGRVYFVAARGILSPCPLSTICTIGN